MTLAATILLALSAITVTVDESAVPKPVAPTFQGVFIEDVSHSADVLMTETGFREEVVGRCAGRLQVQCVNLSDAVRELSVKTGTDVRTRKVPAQAYRCFPLEEARDGFFVRNGRED